MEHRYTEGGRRRRSCRPLLCCLCVTCTYTAVARKGFPCTDCWMRSTVRPVAAVAVAAVAGVAHGAYRQGLRREAAGVRRWTCRPARCGFTACRSARSTSCGSSSPAFRKRHPDRPCVVSSTTDTGLAEARKLFPDWWCFPSRSISPGRCRRTLDRVRPALIVLCESELWPNFLRRAPAAARSAGRGQRPDEPAQPGRYWRLGPLVRPAVRAALDLVAVQTEEYAAAMLALGACPARSSSPGTSSTTAP